MKRWLIWLGILLVAETALLVNNAALDTLAWRATRWFMGDQEGYVWGEYKAAHAGEPGAPFYQRVDPPLTKASNDARKKGVEAGVYKRTESFWRVCRAIGEPGATVILVFVVWIYDRRKWRAAAIMATSMVLAGGVGMLMRAVTGRLRPNGTLLDVAERVRNEGENYWYWFRGMDIQGKANDLSFPSGHATAAFALAAVLAYLSPRGRVLFFVLAGLCALSRVTMQAHFYADVIMGAAVGIAVGQASAAWFDRLLAPKTSTLTPAAA